MQQLLLKSLRISEDLGKFLSFKEEFWDLKLILREWSDELASHPEGVREH
jgi:hypothetical protein